MGQPPMTSAATVPAEPTAVLSSSARPWVTALMSYAKDHAGVRVVGTVLNTSDAIDLQYDVLVVDDIASFMTPRLVQRVTRAGRSIVGVYGDDHEDTGKKRLLEMGVDTVVAASAPPEVFLQSIHSATALLAVDQELDALTVPTPLSASADPFNSVAETNGSRSTGRSDRDRGQIIALTGTSGVGEVAVVLSAMLAGRGQSTLLVDFDTLEPALAQRLGTPLTPNIITALESLRFGGDLKEAFTDHPAGFVFVGGLPNPKDWGTLLDDEVTDLLQELTRGFKHVVVRVNRHVEELSMFGGAGGRFDTARHIVGVADQLVGVSSTSPIGTAELLGWVADVRPLSAAPIHLVLNRAPHGAFQRTEVREELERSFRPASVTFLPYERRLAKAAWQGEVPTRGAFSRKVRGLAKAVAPVESGRRPRGSGDG